MQLYLVLSQSRFDLNFNSIVEKPVRPTTNKRQNWYRQQDRNGPRLIRPLDKIEEIEERI